MSRSQTQAVTTTLAVVQNISIDNPVESNSSPQAVTVTMGTNYIYVSVNPAMKLGTS